MNDDLEDHEWDNDNNEADSGTAVLSQTKQSLEKPPLYKVLLHNDNYTTMEFVVYILKSIFYKSETDAMTIMLAVHNQGVGIAGFYTYEIAEAKVAKTIHLAEANGFPLLCTLEKE